MCKLIKSEYKVKKWPFSFSIDGNTQNLLGGHSTEIWYMPLVVPPPRAPSWSALFCAISDPIQSLFFASESSLHLERLLSFDMVDSTCQGNHVGFKPVGTGVWIYAWTSFFSHPWRRWSPRHGCKPFPRIFSIATHLLSDSHFSIFWISP